MYLMESVDFPLRIGEMCKIGYLVSVFFDMKYYKNSCSVLHGLLNLIKLPVGKNP